MESIRPTVRTDYLFGVDLKSVVDFFTVEDAHDYSLEEIVRQTHLKEQDDSLNSERLPLKGKERRVNWVPPNERS